MANQKTKEVKKAKAKVVALNENTDHSKETTLQQAAAAGKENDPELAEQLYKQQLEKAFNAPVYTKLMILYRKQKKYKEELALINKGLQHFKAYQTENRASKKISAPVKRLSSGLNKSLGLIDKKGNSIYEPEPIPTWKRRKTTVEKKLKTASH